MVWTMRVTGADDCNHCLDDDHDEADYPDSPHHEFDYHD